MNEISFHLDLIFVVFFLRYSLEHEGYYCYGAAKWCIHRLRDVTFLLSMFFTILDIFLIIDVHHLLLVIFPSLTSPTFIVTSDTPTTTTTTKSIDPANSESIEPKKTCQT